MSTTTDVLDRLRRRGELTITATDSGYDVRLVTPGPYVRGRATIDRADLFSHLRLGAKDWHGEGLDLAALLVECDEASRPSYTDIDSLRWWMTHRRDTRTCGPPLPTYMRWRGWSPGTERWLRTSSHANEYLDGYQRDRETERQFEAEQAVSAALRRSRRQFATKAVLRG